MSIKICGLYVRSLLAVVASNKFATEQVGFAHRVESGCKSNV